MQTKLTGRVWKYGDDVNTEVICLKRAGVAVA